MKKKNSPIRGRPQKKNGLTFSLAHKIIPFVIILISMIIATQTCAKDINRGKKRRKNNKIAA